MSAPPGSWTPRRVRVAAGLEELDRWLGDQIRTGLARADLSGRGIETIAARMVDAQAPGVAAALRRLPAVMSTRADWPDVVLGEYARLHLLIVAHRRLDELAPPLAAGVRTHIGYPAPTRAVREEPPVRDRWMALGRRISEEDRLHTRRTWLLGRATGRWALLVEHCFGAPDFAKDVPAPGEMADAGVHYYPAAAPLRVVWGERYGPDEPFTTIPHLSGASGQAVETALEQYARALAADPWLRSWPMLLREVVPAVPAAGGSVVDAGGAALPLDSATAPWRLLGASGGHPVTVLGEWSAGALTPIAALVAGEIIEVAGRRELPSDPPASRPPPDSGPLPAALLGTARRAPDPSALPAPVAALAAGATGEPAVRLLESVAMRDAFTRAGVTAEVGPPLPAPADDDPRPRLPGAAARRLAAMLDDASPFLPEWFAAVAVTDPRAPDDLCALLLEHAHASTRWRAPLLRLAGARGRWLAAHHPRWHALDVTVEETVSESWPPPSPDGRGLARLRARDTEEARQLLVAAWARESGPARAALPAAVRASDPAEAAADEAFLESALDDRRADVRRAAAGLLGLSPGSAYARRMLERAGDWIGRVDLRTGSGSRIQLVVTVPEELDAATRRDGIADRAIEFTYRWAGAPDAAAGRLRQLVAATTLAHWEDALAAPGADAFSPADLLRIGVDDRFRQPLFDGWVDATLAQRDPRWARALFGAGVPSDTALLRRRELFALLPEPDRVRHLLRLDSAWLSEIEALLPALEHPWPVPVAHHLVLLLFERAGVASRSTTHGAGPGAHRSLLTAASVHLPVTLGVEVAALARRCEDPAWERAFDRLADDLTHRSMMLEELP